VGKHARSRIFTGMALSAVLFSAKVALAQESPQTVQQPAAPQELPQDQTQKNAAIPCVQPAPLVGWQDYQGKFAKVVGTFARRLERKSVHPPHYKPGAVLCTLEAKDKFLLFVQDTFDPATFLSVGFSAGIDQAENSDRAFGQGAAGYGKRFGANFAGQASGEFFKDFAYPTLFSEDPRYYRLAHGSGKKRIFHALEHPFVAYREDGTTTFNASEWLGTTSAAVLSNTYHPGNRRGFAPAARAVSYSILQDTGFDLLREFWPEIARKFRLPFRDRNEPANQPSDTVTK
jgi:hypothetical protein